MLQGGQRFLRAHHCATRLVVGTQTALRTKRCPPHLKTLDEVFVNYAFEHGHVVRLVLQVLTFIIFYELNKQSQEKRL